MSCGPLDHSSVYLGDTLRCGGKKQLTVSENDLVFPIDRDEKTSRPQSVRVTNTGRAPVGIKKVLLIRGGIWFNILNNNSYPSSLKKGQSFDIHLNFRGGELRQRLGLLEIYTDEDRLPYTIGLETLPPTLPNGPVQGDVYYQWFTTEIDKITNNYTQLIDKEKIDREWGDETTRGYTIELEAKLGRDIEARVLVEYIARVTAFEAEASARLVLEARFRENEARVESFERAYANAFEAEALQRLTLEARVSDRTDALFVNERIAYANLFSAESTERTRLEARVRGYAESTIQEDRIARVTQYEAEVLARLEMQATYDQNVTARFLQETEARSNQFAAEVQTRERLEANLRGLVASEITTERLARSRAYEALARDVTRLQVNYNSGETPGVDSGARASIVDEREARATALLAEASAREALSAYFVGEFGKTNATIAEERRVRSSDVESLASVSRELTAQLNRTVPSTMGNQIIAVDARVSEETVIRVREDGVIIDRILKIEANYTSSGDVNKSFRQVNARVDDEIRARANAIEAEATRVNSLLTNYATMGSVDAKFTAEVTDRERAISTAVGAEATRVNNLLAGYATTGAVTSQINAEVTNRGIAVANAIGAEATRVDNLLAGYATNGSVASQIRAEITNRGNAIANAVGAEATRVDSLLASYANSQQVDQRISGAINNERNVRVNAEGVIAQSVDEVRGVANAASSNASVALTAANGAKDALGDARVRLLADNGSGRAQVDVFSDRYGNSGIDLTGNVRIFGNLLVTGTVDTPQLALNSVSAPYILQTTQQLVLNTFSMNVPDDADSASNWEEVFIIGVQTAGDGTSVLVSPTVAFDFGANAERGYAPYLKFALYRDGIMVWGPAELTASTSFSDVLSFTTQDNPSIKGTTVYQLKVKIQHVAGAYRSTAQFNANYRNLAVTWLKR